MNTAVNKQKTKLPNFLFIGAAKAASTSVYNYLKQHPEIYMSPKKETNFYVFHEEKLTLPEDIDPETYKQSESLFHHLKENSITEKSDYDNQFSNVRNEIAIGEASLYLQFPRAPERIKQYTPNVKFIVILRDPVERAFSMYLHLIRKGRENRDFKQAVLDEPIESKNFWLGKGNYYVRPGFYAEQLERYFSSFDRNQFKIYLYEDFQSDPKSVIKELFQFLGVDPSFSPNMSKQHTVSGIPINNKFLQVLSATLPLALKAESMALVKKSVKKIIPLNLRNQIRLSMRDARLLNQFNQFKNDSVDGPQWKKNSNNNFKPTMDTETHNLLRDIYKEDIEKLQSMLNKDLSAWMKKK